VKIGVFHQNDLENKEIAPLGRVHARAIANTVPCTGRMASCFSTFQPFFTRSFVL